MLTFGHLLKAASTIDVTLYRNSKHVVILVVLLSYILLQDRSGLSYSLFYLVVVRLDCAMFLSRACIISNETKFTDYSLDRDQNSLRR